MTPKRHIVMVFAPTIVGLFLQPGLCAGQSQNRKATTTTDHAGPPGERGGDAEYALRAASAMPFPNTLTGRAFLSGAESVVRAGNALVIQVQFGCDGGFTHVYDPFFCTADTKRAELRVFDPKGKYVGNALRSVTYDERGRGRWLYIQAQIITGRRVRIATGDRTTFTTGHEPSSRDGIAIDTLGVGKYSLQFVMRGRYIDFREENSDEPQLRRGVREADEICHSNVLEIEVMGRNAGSSDGARGGGPQANQASPPAEALQNSAEGLRAAPFEATLAVENPTIERGGKIDFSVILLNKSDRSAPFMNPWYSFPSPAETTRLLALDSGGKTIGDLLGFRKVQGGGSLTAPTNWITLPPGGVFGIKDRVPASISSLASELPPGTFRIQMVFLDRFTSEHPYVGLPLPEAVADAARDPLYIERLKKWRNEHPGKELFRSNAVEIKIVDQK
jgi:hypothetical protein